MLLFLLLSHALAQPFFDDVRGLSQERKLYGQFNDPSHHVCSGFDEQWGLCPEMESCSHCEPEDCVFEEWGQWFDAGGCTQIDFRQRGILVSNNECGTPCEGNKMESRSSPHSRCIVNEVDCQWTEWSSWSDCGTPNDQSTRSRTISQKNTGQGQPCIGDMKETRPCSPGPSPEDCLLSDWHEWSECSSPCGPGVYSRFRKVIQEAQHEGRSCDGVIHETDTCEVRPCDSMDCQMSEWSEWSSINPTEENAPPTDQLFRTRTVVVPPGMGGSECPGGLIETKPQIRPSQPCVVGDWSFWSECDRTCAGGQKMRERSVEPAHAFSEDEDGCGYEVQKMIAPCGLGPCHEAGTSDCQLSEWDEWSECSSRCGTGSKSRSRSIVSESMFGGNPCEGPLKELARCEVSECNIVNCRWGDWSGWSDCSCECGGGTKRRTRHVAEAPRNGGLACEPQDKEEAFPCSTQPCGQGCIDGKWGAWGEWTHCSASCASSYRSRSRNLEIQPSPCGKAAAGHRDEFELCTDLPPCIPDSDCEIHEWGEWSHCSCHCFGIRERNRYISHFATGKGKPCPVTALKVVEPCNPGPVTTYNPDEKYALPIKLEDPPLDCQEKPPVNCELHPWNEWTQCSSECGGGQRERSRTVRTAPKHGGQPCESDLTIVEPCNEEPCHEKVCTDCQWGAWSEWSGCSRCGGQKYRHRSIVQMANNCGKECDVRSAKETTSCISECAEPLFCAWTQWSGSTACESCGPATTMRNRALGFTTNDPGIGQFLFKVVGESECAGTQLNVSLCASASSGCSTCEPRNCAFSTWGEWGEPTCEGLCERLRTIEVTNNECGEPCAGPLHSTKQCSVECDKPKDCEFSAWSEWSQCPPFQSQSQRSRSRTIVQQPENEGLACVGALEETIACEYSHLKVDCTLSPWKEWGPCSRTCGGAGGWKERSRVIEELAAGGGVQCTGGLNEIESCLEGPEICPGYEAVDCQFGAWGEWSEPDPDYQRKRIRKIVQMSLHGGDPCSGPMEEADSTPPVRTDCVVSAWTEWEACDRSCGGGQSYRHRQVQRFPQAGGTPCPKDLKVTRSCNSQSCDGEDCMVSEWSVWGDCSSSCGAGQHSRSRHIIRLRSIHGLGCALELGMTQSCEGPLDCGKLDCFWGDWSEWSGCTCSCDGGQKTRTRHVAQAPAGGGLPCQESDKEQIAPCMTQKCSETNCRDGQWGDWSDWSGCSVSCGGGVTFRRRRVEVMANHCGEEPVGKNSEVGYCHVGVPCSRPIDCELSQWQAWSACSGTCDGLQHRARVVKVYGRGTGEWCKGGLRETAPCNPAQGEALPEGCGPGPAEDCVFGEWEAWKECSVTCGGGEHTRSRSIVQNAKNAGIPCNGPLKEVSECARQSCGGPEPKDCIFAEWEEWGACGKCSGQRKRFRRIAQYPEAGGKECELTNTEEAGSCPRKCHEKQYCGWAEWEAWGSCSSTCGQGYRQRRRQLRLSPDADSVLIPAEMIREYDNLVQRTQELDAQHFRELAMAFVAGGACLTLVFGVIRGWPFARQGPAGLETGSSRMLSRVTGFLPRNDNAEIANGDYFLVASEHETELPWASRDLELELSS